MKTLRCIAVDDEPLALAQLRKYILKTPGLQLVAACCDAIQAKHAIEDGGGADLLFLDINMPGMSGMDFARTLEPGRPLVIFTTAYSEYAVEGFKVEAVDYLLKPFGYGEFTEAVGRASRRLRQDNEADDAIYVRDSGATRRILLGDIRMIKGLAEYVQIFLASSPRPVTTLMSMRSLEQTLPSDRFMRIHRSYIVNLKAIEAVDHGKVVIGNDRLPVSDSYREQFNSYIRRLKA